MCPKTFPCKAELRSHLVSKDHHRQSVICPWCTTEKTFTRVADLNVHAHKRHFIEINSLSRDFLSMGNCFYFAVYPEDYAKIYKPVQYGSPDAIEARRLVVKCLNTQSRSSSKIDNWRSGWRTANMEPKENQPVKEKKENDVKKEKVKVETSVTKDKKNVLDELLGTENVPAETPLETPLDLSLKVDKPDKELKGKGVSAKRKDVEEREKEVKRRKEEEIQSMSKDVKSNLKDRKVLKDIVGNIRSDIVDRALGVKEQTKTVEKNRKETADGVEKVVEEKKDKTRTLSDSSDSELGDDETKKAEKGGEKEIVEVKREEKGAGATELPRRIIRWTKRNGKLCREIRQEGTDEKSETGKPNKTVTFADPLEDSKSVVLDTPNEKGDAPIFIPDEVEETLVASKFIESVAENVSVPAVVTEDDYRRRAIDLLHTGVMPMLPPGRRDWKTDHCFQIKMYGHEFVWPPHEWSVMSADRRLMAWEVVAFQIEVRREGALGSSVSRSYLLDKYNFLALPGSGKVRREPSERGATMARYHLYQMLRGIAEGKATSEAERRQIECLELMRVEGDLEVQLRGIEVPLRLEK